MVFFQTGELFQGYAVGKSRRNIAALMDIRPDTARIVKNGETEEVELDELIEFVYEARLGDVYGTLEEVLTEGVSNLTPLNIPPEINF